jgi:hypothetical protein
MPTARTRHLHPIRFNACFRAVVSAGLLLVAMAAAPARADEFVDRANALVRKVGDDKRSDKVILPLLVDMTPPPAVL